MGRTHTHSTYMGQSQTKDTAMVAQQIDAEIAGNKVVVYSKTYCPYCTKTKDLLKSLGVDFKLIELDTVDNGSTIQAYLAEKTGQRTVPNIFIGGAHQGGNSDLQAAHQSGAL